MTKIREQEAKEHSLPHPQVGRGSQHQGLIEREEEVQVRQLRQDYAGRERHVCWVRGRGREVRHLQVGGLLEVGEVGSCERADGLDDEEEDRVDGWEFEGWRRHDGVE